MSLTRLPPRGAVRRPTPLLAVDLDGSVRHGPDELGRFVNCPDDVAVFPAAIARMRRWKRAGGRVIGVTNQVGIALGHLTHEVCAATLRRTNELTGGLFDRIQVCPHHRRRSTRPGPVLVPQAAPRPANRGRACAHGDLPGDLYPPHLGLFVGDRPEDEECAARGLPLHLGSGLEIAGMTITQQHRGQAAACASSVLYQDAGHDQAEPNTGGPR